jgi:TusA-related sulfurtransferase
MAMEALQVDARGEICPAPMLKAADAMKQALEGQPVEVLVDFLPAILTITNAAVKGGWDVDVRRRAIKEWAIILRRAPSVSPV